MIFENGVYVCECSNNERHIPDKAGFIFNPLIKRWETAKISKAVRLREYFSADTKKYFNKVSLKSSTPWTGGFPLNKNHQLKGFQKRGVKFALSRNHSYLAFDMGLGKTPTAISIMQAASVYTLIICPPFLVINWQKEIEKFTTRRPLDMVMLNRKGDASCTFTNPKTFVLICPDSLIDSEAVQKYLAQFDFDLTIVDEAHRFKTLKAQRTKALFKIVKAPRVVLLSGTPMPNRPLELYPVVSAFAWNRLGFMSQGEYAKRYCNARLTKRGWDMSGASNLDELNGLIMNHFMLRETKAVLKDLPPKIENAVFLNAKATREVKRLESVILKRCSLEQLVSNRKGTEGLGDIARYRSLVGKIKTKPSIEYIRNILENTNESLLILCWHISVITEIHQALKRDTEIICGATNKTKRHSITELFQKGKVRGIVAQIQTMVGLNLTRGTRAIVVEPPWVPADLDQGVDRLHRIGQLKQVVVDCLILPDSLDEFIVNAILRKRKIISKLINKGSI